MGPFWEKLTHQPLAQLLKVSGVAYYVINFDKIL